MPTTPAYIPWAPGGILYARKHRQLGYRPTPAGGGTPATVTYLQSVFNPAVPGITIWKHVGAGYDTAGASFPGPGPFGACTNFTALGSW